MISRILKAMRYLIFRWVTLINCLMGLGAFTMLVLIMIIVQEIIIASLNDILIYLLLINSWINT